MILVFNKKTLSLIDYYENISIKELANIYEVDSGNLSKVLNNKTISSNSNKKLNTLNGYYFIKFSDKNKEINMSSVERTLKIIKYFKESSISKILKDVLIDKKDII